MMLCLSSLCYGAKTKPSKQTPTVEPAPTRQLIEKKISKIFSGDTLIADDETIIRLAGIDTFDPQHLGWVDSLNPKRRQVADAAVKRLSELTLDKTVFLETPKEFFDAYGRVWAYVFLADDSCINEKMLEEGMAQILPGTPDHGLFRRFETAQKKAVEQKLGIWSIDPESIKIDLSAYNSQQKNPSDDAEKYAPPKPQAKPETSSDGFRINGTRFFFALLIAGGLGTLLYYFKKFTDTKICPMCNAVIPKRLLVCSNCNYNYKTGFMGDSELQQWVTQNIRVVKKKDTQSRN